MPRCHKVGICSEKYCSPYALSCIRINTSHLHARGMRTIMHISRVVRVSLVRRFPMLIRSYSHARTVAPNSFLTLFSNIIPSPTSTVTLFSLATFTGVVSGPVPGALVGPSRT